MIGVREHELLTVIQAAMAGQLPAQVLAGLSTGGLLKQNGHDEPYWFGDARFARLRLFDTQEVAGGGQAREEEEMQAALAGARTLGQAAEIVGGALMRKLARAVMVEVEEMDAGRAANSYGVDSLVAVEVRAWVFKEVRSDVSVFDILSNAPLTVLAGKIAARSSLVSLAVRSEEDL